VNRFLLALSFWSYVITPVALSADGPVNNTTTQPVAENRGSVYVKIIGPVDPAAPVVARDQPVIESWITKSIEHRGQGKFNAVTRWVPLVDEPYEGEILWSGAIDGKAHACRVYADITERKDGWIKISFRGWDPFGSQATATLKDEPGSREVVPVTQAKTKHGIPHVAIFIGLPVK